MAQWLRPKLSEGPLRTFNRELHALHGMAGYPSARRISQAVGKVVSHTNIHHAFIKASLPSWGVVEVVVEHLARQARPRRVTEAEVDRFKVLWDEAHTSASEPAPVTGAPESPSMSDHASGSDPARSSLGPSAFVSRNGLIHAAIIDLYKAGKPVGVPEVAAELKRRGQLESCGGEDYLFECVKSCIKGAYESGMSIQEFGIMNARKVHAAGEARSELMAVVFDRHQDPERLRVAVERFEELHPNLAHQPGRNDAKA